MDKEPIKDTKAGDCCSFRYYLRANKELFNSHHRLRRAIQLATCTKGPTAGNDRTTIRLP